MRVNIQTWVTVSLLLALIVLGLGSYTRLTDAGLGCPDWPGCYGQLHVPHTSLERQQAQALYPQQPIETEKAWTEMIHRYLAGLLGVLIMVGAVWGVRRAVTGGPRVVGLPLFLCAWVVFQALLGRFTVTWRLLPIVVLAHLLSGTVLFASLSVYRGVLSEHRPPILPVMRYWFLGGMLLVFLQIALGGWVSANYAGMACVGFPTCNGSWVPLQGLMQSFQLSAPMGDSYQGGVLASQSRAAIQVLHRLGAVAVALYVGGVLYGVWRYTTQWFWRAMTICLLSLVIVQWGLGIINVLFFLPLPIAVLHHIVAVGTFTLLVMMWFWSHKHS